MNELTIKNINADFLSIKKDILILYNTMSADNSRFLFQKNAKLYPGKVAVMAQFIPNFR